MTLIERHSSSHLTKLLLFINNGIIKIQNVVDDPPDDRSGNVGQTAIVKLVPFLNAVIFPNLPIRCHLSSPIGSLSNRSSSSAVQITDVTCCYDRMV